MTDYKLLPFNFTRIDDNILLVGDSGIYHFMDPANFDLFIQGKLDISSEKYFDLEGKLFATSGKLSLPVRMLAARYRSRMGFLRDFTTLHMMALTLRCNQKCDYCQVSSAETEAVNYDMSCEVAEKVIDFIFQSPAKAIKIEFQGGEPTLNWNAIVASVERAEKLSKETGKNSDFVICTNLLKLTDEQLDFYKEHQIQISTSLDGPANIHDKYRKTRSGSPTHDNILRNIRRCQSAMGKDSVSALLTVSADSLFNLKDIVDEYISLGMDGIFIRSLNPYGLAAQNRDKLGYEMAEFSERYLDALEYIFEVNNSVYFPEYFATLLFTRIMTWMPTGFVDLQSPAGAGISGVIYDYDGSIYPADEARMLARMGDAHFRLGNVANDTFRNIFGSEKQRELTRRSVIETSIPCAWCAFRTYCGCDPIRNYLESGSDKRNMAGTPFCIKHKNIFTGLFRILRDADEKRLDIIWSWIRNRPEIAGHAVD